VCSAQHTLSGVTLTVTVLESQPDVDVCAIHVSGILSSHTRDFITLYFENPKRSGGGPIEELVDSAEGIAVITFASAQSMNLLCYILVIFCRVFLLLKFRHICT